MNFPVAAFQASNEWKRWRAILDRIVSHPEYRYESEKKYPLIKLAQFASNELAHFNNKYWRIVIAAGPEAKAIAVEESRRDNELRARLQMASLTRWRAEKLRANR